MKIGDRVRVHAEPSEGTDHEWHGHFGTILRCGQWIEVRMDRTKRYWSNPVMICAHNLRSLKKVGR